MERTKKLYEAEITRRKRAYARVKESLERALAKATDLGEDLSKAEALCADEVAKVADKEATLTKAEATFAKMIVKIVERDQMISRLRANLEKSKGTWKKAAAHMEASIATYTKKNLSKNHASKMKEQDDLITILCIQLRAKRRALRKLRTQFHWVVIVCNCAWYRSYV